MRYLAHGLNRGAALVPATALRTLLMALGLLAALVMLVLAALSADVRSAGALDVSVLAAGDIASGSNANDEATAKVLRAHAGMPILPLGDDAYDGGSSSEFSNYYAPTWGTEKARTKPVPGNHEYVGGTTKQYGAGYFNYFGAAAHQENAGSYSYDLGAWHVIALNTGQCHGTLEADGSSPRCGPGDAMITWLHDDLAAHTNAQCT